MGKINYERGGVHTTLFSIFIADILPVWSASRMYCFCQRIRLPNSGGFLPAFLSDRHDVAERRDVDLASFCFLRPVKENLSRL